MNSIITNAKSLFDEIRSDFSAIWSSKIRGETLEIITPFSTVLGNAISVFLTQREDRFIVSDGKCLCQMLSENELDSSNKTPIYLEEFASRYGVKKTQDDQFKQCFYFKSTTNLKLLTAYIYDIAFFENAAINSIYSSQTFFRSDDVRWQRFSTKVNNVLEARINEHRAQNKFFHLDRQNQLLKNLRFNAVLIKDGSPHIWLAMCISGFTAGAFYDHYGRASMGFDVIRRNAELSNNSHISIIIDEKAQGYDPSNQMLEGASRHIREVYKPHEYKFTEFEHISDLDRLFEENVAV